MPAKCTDRRSIEFQRVRAHRVPALHSPEYEIGVTLVRFSNNSELEIRCLGAGFLTSDRVLTRGQMAE
jgi:hypothetical protein